MVELHCSLIVSLFTVLSLHFFYCPFKCAPFVRGLAALCLFLWHYGNFLLLHIVNMRNSLNFAESSSPSSSLERNTLLVWQLYNLVIVENNLSTQDVSSVKFQVKFSFIELDWFGFSQVRRTFPGWPTAPSLAVLVPRGPARSASSSTWPRRMMLGSMLWGDPCLKKVRLQMLILSLHICHWDDFKCRQHSLAMELACT